MNYTEIDQTEYDRKLRLVIVGAEGLHAQAQNIGDGKATIGWGYTLNRGNNVAIWRESNIELTQAQWQTLASVDAAPKENRTGIGLTFSRQLNEAESDQLLRASMAEYEAPANSLNMPLSDEKIAMVSLTYNRGPGNLAGMPQSNVPEHPVMQAIRNEDRAEAWFQMRYNCWGSDKLDEQYPNTLSNEGGLRKRRFAEAEVFGLYDDPQNVTSEQARAVYRTFQLHRDEVDRVERDFGITVEGNEAGRNRIAQANRDYPELVAEYGRVSTIADALAPARTALLQDMRQQYPNLAETLTDANFNAGRIYLDPNRELQDSIEVDAAHPTLNRTQNAVRREQRNSTLEEVDENHVTTLNTQRMSRGQNPQEIDSNDIIVSGGGDDTLKGARGNDILIGGQGADTYVVGNGDVVQDSDHLGQIRWDEHQLTGGIRQQTDPANTYRSADGQYTYVLNNTDLAITNSVGETVNVKNFENGSLGITLSGPEALLNNPARPNDNQPIQLPPTASRSNDDKEVVGLTTGLQVGNDFREKGHPGNASYEKMLGEVQRMETTNSIAHGPNTELVAAALTVKAEQSKFYVAEIVRMEPDGQLSALKLNPFGPSLRVSIDPKEVVAQGQSFEKSTEAWSLARSRQYASDAPAAERTLEQVKALAQMTPMDQSLFEKIRQNVPSHISDDVVAKTMLQAKKEGVSNVDQIDNIAMAGDGITLKGRIPGMRSTTDVNEPTAPMAEAVKQTDNSNQQLAIDLRLQQKQLLAKKQEQENQGTTMQMAGGIAMRGGGS
jgi:GH24 family phage-related lysozyme (muramidase)